MTSQWITSTMAALSVSLLLTACSGGGGGQSAGSGTSTEQDTIALPATSISGVFDGSIDSTQPVTTILLDDGSFYQVYSDAASPNVFLGAIAGPGSLVSGSLSSSAGRDLSLRGNGAQSPAAPVVTLSASLQPQQSLNGTLSYAETGLTKAFTATFNSSYEKLPDLAAIAGVYQGSIATKDLKEENIKLTISADGSLKAELTCGCEATARLVPRADGKAYDAAIAFSAGKHPLAERAMSGNVYVDILGKRIYIVGKLTESSDVAIFVGNKS